MSFSSAGLWTLKLDYIIKVQGKRARQANAKGRALKTSTDISKLFIDINATLSNVNELFMKINRMKTNLIEIKEESSSE